jgi:Holliday junction resolvasome RuvABC endonuclease subunit
MNMASEPTLMAIDPSSTCCGAAVFSRGKLVNAWRVTPARTRDDAATRITAMVAELHELIIEFNVRDVVIEEPLLTAMPGRHKSNAVLQRVFGRIYQWACDQGVRVHSVPVNVWTRGRKKRQRAGLIPGLDSEKDKGLDGADAIGLGQWWVAEQRLQGV